MCVTDTVPRTVTEAGGRIVKSTTWISVIARLASAAAVASAVGMATDAHATTIVFDDETDTLTATVDNEKRDCTAESCSVRLRNFLANPVSQDYLAHFKIVDPTNSDDAKGTISDIVSFAVPAETPKDLIVGFNSDPIESILLEGPFYNGNSPLEERGSPPQDVTLPADLPKLAAGNTLTVQFTSDVTRPEPVPEAGTLCLVSLGIFLFACIAVACSRSDASPFRSGRKAEGGLV